MIVVLANQKGKLGWFWERKSKSRGGGGLFYLVETGKSLGLICVSFLQNF
jgi:hypothetical protein